MRRKFGVVTPITLSFTDHLLSCSNTSGLSKIGIGIFFLIKVEEDESEYYRFFK